MLQQPQGGQRTLAGSCHRHREGFAERLRELGEAVRLRGEPQPARRQHGKDPLADAPVPLLLRLRPPYLPRRTCRVLCSRFGMGVPLENVAMTARHAAPCFPTAASPIGRWASMDMKAPINLSAP